MNELILSASLYVSSCRPIRKWTCNRDMAEESIMLEYPYKRVSVFFKVSHTSRHGTSQDRGTEEAGIGIKVELGRWKW